MRFSYGEEYSPKENASTQNQVSAEGLFDAILNGIGRIIQSSFQAFEMILGGVRESTMERDPRLALAPIPIGDSSSRLPEERPDERVFVVNDLDIYMELPEL